MLRYLLLLILSATSSMCLIAQSERPSLSLQTYVDAYYAYYNNRSFNGSLQPYTTTSARDRRFSLNIAQLGLSYTSDRLRSNVTLHYGDIPQAIWSPLFPFVQEGNVGLRLGGDWWLDAGLFKTHIGAESFLPKDNFFTSTAFIAYNEPFYQAGARLSYSGSEKWYFELWLVNGYNGFGDINSAKSPGILFRYNLSEKSSITYANLFGRESPDGDTSQFRTYHNLYLNSALSNALFLQAGVDFGTQSNSAGALNSETAIMYNALLSLRYAFNEQYALSGRYEYFNDPEGFISGLIPTVNGFTGLQMHGFTMSFEYAPVSNAYLRLEGRYLQSDEDLLLFDNDAGNSRYELILNMGYYFQRDLL